MRAPRGGWVAGWLLATPAFAAADAVWEAPVRVAGILTPDQRFAYYGAVFVLGLACRRWPAAAPWAGMLEASTNLLLLLLSILLPIWSLGEAAASGAPLPVGLTPAAAANALLSGGALVLAFRRHEDAALGPRRSGRRFPGL